MYLNLGLIGFNGIQYLSMYTVIPFFSGIVLTPTPSILKSPSIHQSPVLFTITSTFIQASPTTTEVLSSSTLSPAEEKTKRRKEGKRRWVLRDGCVSRSFFDKKAIHNTRQSRLFGFFISCTTQTVYTVRYTNGSLCSCGEYSVKDQTKTKTCDAKLTRLNFTVEISVRSIRNQWGENCSLSFFFP